MSQIDQVQIVSLSDKAGDSYQDLSAKFWNWVVGIPDSNDHPIKYQDHEKQVIVESRTGSVFFLAGSFGGGSYRRIVHIPKNKRIFLPVINVIASQAEGDGNNDNELIKVAADTMTKLTPLEVKVDKNVIPQNVLRQYAVEPFAFTLNILDDDNVLRDHGAKKSSGRAATAGYCLLLEPLPPGEHTIDIKGHADPDEHHPETTEIDVQYNVTVTN